MPEFDEENWPFFCNKFRSLVHDRTDINIILTSFLHGQLKGSAYLLVAEQRVVHSSYDEAVRILNENHEDKDFISENLVYKLLKLTGHNYSELQSSRISLS